MEIEILNKENLKIGILFQAVPSPEIDGVVKPMKQGGYSDSGADIAFNLKKLGYKVITPVKEPDPSKDSDWVFPDTEEGILNCCENHGANVLWLNTVLFEGHPIMKVKLKNNDVKIVGQIPSLTSRFDDKYNTNQLLYKNGIPIPACFIATSASASNYIPFSEISETLLKKQNLTFPIVIKPIRGRGSQGVIVVKDLVHMLVALKTLSQEVQIIGGKSYLKYGNHFLVEQYLAGTEITITVMPPGKYKFKQSSGVVVWKEQSNYWALPPVERFDHIEGVIPYNGIVSIIQNSRALNLNTIQKHPNLQEIMKFCEKAASIVQAKAPLRIDCRAAVLSSFTHFPPFFLFDLNMKPNMTGPGRPNRSDQDNLCNLSAQIIGWDYGNFLENILLQAWTLPKDWNI